MSSVSIAMPARGGSEFSRFPKALEELEPDMTQAQVKEMIKEIDPPKLTLTKTPALGRGYDHQGRLTQNPLQEISVTDSLTKA